MSTEVVEQYLSEFTNLTTGDSLAGPDWLWRVRESAIKEFAELGFPSPREEKWRFTNFSKLAERKFALSNGHGIRPLPVSEEDPAVGWWSDFRVVFVDGVFSSELSSVGELPGGAVFGNLASVLSNRSNLLQPELAQVVVSAESPFAALNTAFFTDGGLLSIPDRVRIERPIQFLYLTSDGGEGAVSYPRNIVLVGENAEATVVESYIGLGNSITWTNSVTEIVLNDAARLKLHRTQQEGTGAYHTATTQCRQGRDSNLTFSTVDFGSSLSRHDLGIKLNGTGASCSLRGLSHLREKQHADNQTTIEHAKPHCTSVEQFNGIYDDRSHGVFTGRVLVRPDAQKTDAIQSSKNLLLSDTARADSQPQLEIFADDVKCTHGSTVGPIDEAAVFYLRSKGLTADEARWMLTYGFAVEIIDAIGISGLRERLVHVLKSRLGDESRDASRAL